MICLKGTIEKKPNAGRTDVKLKCLKCPALGHNKMELELEP